jgi:superfamily I DNA/RNA helicase
MAKIAKIHGGPGCGKTTFLIDQLGKDLAKYPPENTGAMSLSKASVETIRRRAFTSLKIPYEAGRYYRTLHSICFHLLGKPALAKTGDFSKDCPEYAMTAESGQDDNDQNTSVRRNDYLFREMQKNRNKRLSPNQWDKDVLDFWLMWADWCEQNGKSDYTMFLEKVISYDLIPDDLEVIYVDECQDHSNLAMSVIGQWAAQAKKLVLIGDSDQALFRFSGAVPEMFVDMPCDFEKILGKTWRLPRKIRDYALEMISKCGYRAPVTYDFDEKNGDGLVSIADIPDLSLPGTHMILTRCNNQLAKYIRMLSENNLIWHNPNRPKDLTWNPIQTKEWQALRIWQKMIGCESLTWHEVRDMSDCLVANTTMIRGTKKKLKDVADSEDMADPVFDLIPFGFKEEFVFGKVPISDAFRFKSEAGRMAKWYAENDSEQLGKRPNIIIGTVHSVKGDEADHVWFDSELTRRILNEIRFSNTSWDDEVRVAYVAITRARKSFNLIRRGVNPFF